MKSLNKKIIFGLVIAILAAQIIFTPKPSTALVVFDPAVFGQSVTNLVTEIVRWVKEDMFKFMRDQIAFRIMNKVASDTAQWISGGGKPQYITDWNRFVKGAADIAFDSIIKEVGLARLCQPFSLQIKIGLLPERRFKDQISCTLDDVVRNINNFYVNFENGGWLAYNEVWEPQNNYFGQMILIQDQIQIQTSKKVTAAVNEAVSGSGFLSQKQCVDWDEEELDDCLNSQWEEGVSDERKMEICQQEVKCTKEEVITPGDTIGKAAAEAITTDSKWAQGIESWMSMLVNSLINRAMKEGINAIKNAGGRGSSNGGSSGEITQLVDNQLIQEQQMMIKDLQKFVSEWQYYLNDKNKAISYTQQEEIILNQINAINCLPPVPASQITSLQGDISRLQHEAEDLQNKINEANKLIADLNATNSTARLIDLQQQYVGFLNKYNSLEFQQALVDGSGRRAADEEANKYRQDLQDARDRLSTCTAVGG